jgi:hypothetical protein
MNWCSKIGNSIEMINVKAIVDSLGAKAAVAQLSSSCHAMRTQTVDLYIISTLRDEWSGMRRRLCLCDDDGKSLARVFAKKEAPDRGCLPDAARELIATVAASFHLPPHSYHHIYMYSLSHQHPSCIKTTTL